MQRLSSCYFCGDAVDAAIEEYPLVSSDRFDSIDTDQRVVLCPPCRRKLTTVIERVLEAALGGDEPDAETEELLTELDNGEEMSVTGVEKVDPPDQLGRGETAADTEDATDDSGSADESDDSDTGASEDTSVSANGDDPGGASDESRSEETDGEDASDTADPVAQAAAQGSSSDSGDAPAGSTNGADQSDATAGEREGAESAAEAVEREVGYRKAEFNKVVKLLQNREFPVEIDELTVVAGSAYGIDEETTHSIIDALIERGIVADDGDELVRA